MTRVVAKNAERQTNGRRVAWVLGIGIAVLVVVFGAFYLTAGFGQPTLKEHLEGAGAARINATEETDELCAEKQCLSGWSTDVGDYLEFESEGAAEYWETVLGDVSRRDGKILLDMSGFENTFAEQKLAIDMLFAHKDWQ